MKILKYLRSILVVAIWTCSAAHASTLVEVQERWAEIMYQSRPDQREAQLSALAEITRAATLESPRDATLLVWNGIVLSTLAGKVGGLEALGLARESRASLEAALEIEPAVRDGSAYTSLGTLYHKVPGWPLGFGSDKRARELLERALDINPDGLDPNYFMGEFLLDEGDPKGARRHLLHAAAAPDRAGLEVADRGRREEVRALLARAAKES
jgi:tetratricopeptide (TPR) repeat protein